MFARMVVLLCALIAIGDAMAQSAAKPASAKVMIVGTFHLDNPGRDVFNVQVDDVLLAKTIEPIPRQTRDSAPTDL